MILVTDSRRLAKTMKYFDFLDAVALWGQKLRNYFILLIGLPSGAKKSESCGFLFD